MMATTKWYMPLMIFILFRTVRANPICQTANEKNVICRPGNTDIILKRGVVPDNNKATDVTLRGCRITDLDLEAFKALPVLDRLDLSQNFLRNLTPGALDFQLSFLNLSHNKLTELPPGLFDKMDKLEYLDLKANRINQIQQGVLAPLKILKHLDLSSNMLVGRQLSPYVFSENNLISFMDFSRNDMIGAPDNLLQTFHDLEFLNLEKCFLGVVPSFARKSVSMKHLMLSTNQITKLDNPVIFLELDNLEILNLAENAINSIDANVFKPLRKLKNLILRNNNLKTIPDTTFQNMPKLVTLNLARNLIEFVPVSAFRGSGIKTLNIGGNKFTYLTDNFCLELKNSGTNLKKLYFGDNPWQCPCMLDILKEVRKMGIAYNNDKYDGKRKVCVIDNIQCQRQITFNEIYQEMYVELIG